MSHVRREINGLRVEVDLQSLTIGLGDTHVRLNLRQAYTLRDFLDREFPLHIHKRRFLDTAPGEHDGPMEPNGPVDADSSAWE